MKKISGTHINKKEFFIIAALLLTALISWLLVEQDGKGVKATITIGKEIYEVVDLSTDQILSVYSKEGSYLMTIEICSDSIQVIKSVCPDKICIDQGSISKNGETIVCLPNQVVISIIDGQENDDIIDGMLK